MNEILKNTYGLTDEEIFVCRKVQTGLKGVQLSSHLGISGYKLKRILKSIFDKLQICGIKHLELKLFVIERLHNGEFH